MNSTLIALAGNDADLVEAFVRHHATLVDVLVVVDQASCDGTRDILEALRHDGLPLVIVDDPQPGIDETAKLTQLHRRVVTVFNPDLVFLLGADQFIRATDRASLEAELQHLPPGGCAILPRRSYVPDAATAARATLADPIASIARRPREDDTEGRAVVLRRDPADDLSMTVESPALAWRHADGREPDAFLAQSVQLACFPVRGTAQLAARMLHEWIVHRARHARQPEPRQTFRWRTLFDRVLAGRDVSPEDAVQAALALAAPGRTNGPVDLVDDPVPHTFATPLHAGLRRRDAVATALGGLDWPAPLNAATGLATGRAMDLAPALDLCANLGARRVVVMAEPGWSAAFAQARPGLILHVPREDQADPPLDLVLIPDAAAGFAEGLAGTLEPAQVRCAAWWPAERRGAGELARELDAWRAAGWVPDMLRTMTFRLLASYGVTRQSALVMVPARAEGRDAGRAEAVRDALVALDAGPLAWVDPPASLVVHPLQSATLEAVPAAATRPEAPAPAPARPPRSVLIVGAGRSGTSALAGMFGPDTHHHADNLYAAQVSNPKGFFEAAHINDLNESILVHSALSHLGEPATRALLQGFEPHQLWLARFPDDMPAICNDAQRRQIAQCVARTPFCLKDPRMSVSADAWLDAAPDALMLAIHRPPQVTAESILRECRVATYLLDLRISARDALAVWRQAYRRAVKHYRAGRDVLFLRYEDLFDPTRLDRLEALVRAPLRRDFAEARLNRTDAHMQVDEECRALHGLLEALGPLSFEGRRAEAHGLIDAHLARWPDRTTAGLPATLRAA